MVGRTDTSYGCGGVQRFPLYAVINYFSYKCFNVRFEPSVLQPLTELLRLQSATNVAATNVATLRTFIGR